MSFGPDPDDAFDFVSELTGWMRNGLDQAAEAAALAALRPRSPNTPPNTESRTNPATWIIQAHKP